MCLSLILLKSHKSIKNNYSCSNHLMNTRCKDINCDIKNIKGGRVKGTVCVYDQS